MNTEDNFRAYTVPQWCKAQNISLSQYYKLRNRGLGPKEMRLGGAVRISAQATLDWQHRRQNPDAAEAAAIEEQRARLIERSRRGYTARRRASA